MSKQAPSPTTRPAIVLMTAALVLGLFVPVAGLAQDAPPSPPKAYKPVPVTLPKPVSDPSFTSFRKELSGIAAKKDRAALSRVLAPGFFWIPEDKDVADSKKPAIDTLSAAIGLEGQDAPGWDLLAGYADEASAEPHPEQKGAICGPAEPTFDEKAAEQLAAATDTEPAEWGYAAMDGIEVRSGPEPTSPVMEKLGLHLVRVYPDDTPMGAVHSETLRIVTPSGKVGYVPVEFILPLVSDQLCYRKDGNTWKIAGAIGGLPPGR